MFALPPTSSKFDISPTTQPQEVLDLSTLTMPFKSLIAELCSLIDASSLISFERESLEKFAQEFDLVEKYAISFDSLFVLFQYLQDQGKRVLFSVLLEKIYDDPDVFFLSHFEDLSMSLEDFEKIKERLKQEKQEPPKLIAPEKKEGRWQKQKGKHPKREISLFSRKEKDPCSSNPFVPLATLEALSEDSSVTPKSDPNQLPYFYKSDAKEDSHSQGLEETKESQARPLSFTGFSSCLGPVLSVAAKKIHHADLASSNFLDTIEYDLSLGELEELGKACFERNALLNLSEMTHFSFETEGESKYLTPMLLIKMPDLASCPKKIRQALVSHGVDLNQTDLHLRVFAAQDLGDLALSVLPQPWAFSEEDVWESKSKEVKMGAYNLQGIEPFSSSPVASETMGSVELCLKHEREEVIPVAENNKFIISQDEQAMSCFWLAEGCGQRGRISWNLLIRDPALLEHLKGEIIRAKHEGNALLGEVLEVLESGGLEMSKNIRRCLLSSFEQDRLWECASIKAFPAMIQDQLLNTQATTRVRKYKIVDSKAEFEVSIEMGTKHIHCTIFKQAQMNHRQFSQLLASLKVAGMTYTLCFSGRARASQAKNAQRVQQLGIFSDIRKALLVQLKKKQTNEQQYLFSKTSTKINLHINPQLRFAKCSILQKGKMNAKQRNNLKGLIQEKVASLILEDV